MKSPRLPLLLAVALAAFSPARAQVTFQFDYSFDTTLFSGGNIGNRTYLEAAGTYVAGLISNTALSAITPGGANSWTPQPFDPRDINASLSPGNLSIAANTILVYVGGYDLDGSTLGVGGPGGYGASGNQAWFDLLASRGNGTFSMASMGSITFDTLTSWYFDNDTSTTEAFPGQSDFFSVAVHELFHLVGFGTGNSWDGLVSGGTFTGAASKANYLASPGSAVPLAAGNGHWADGTTSTIIGAGGSQETAMDPTITVGTRKYATVLDVAGLQDIGYATAVPEPSAFAALAGLLVLGLAARRRRAA